MRLRRIAMGGVLLGLLGVAVRAEGRAVGRVLLGVSDARVSEAVGVAAGRGRAGAAVGVRQRSVCVSRSEVRA
ncbi:hypothetical protein [Streptomyces sp. LUP47B]|uniref:hypothetical protein n=1 Tax=Streptomyces sp. LUP47B TaxID=1890286 RepID=UPI00114D2C5B|nr:hypothetical protein [Streptomyces sp. LUP47B]